MRNSFRLDENRSLLYQPIPFRPHSRLKTKSHTPLLIYLWIFSIALSVLLSVLVSLNNWSGIPVSLGGTKIHITIYPPLIISVMWTIWFGFWWGFIPAYLATFIGSLAAGMKLHWALMFSFADVIGLAVIVSVYRIIPLQITLHNIRSIAFFIFVMFVAGLLGSSGSFIWTSTNKLGIQETFAVWQGWWVGAFLQGVLINGPLLFLFSPSVIKWKEKNLTSQKWSVPSINEVRVTFLFVFVILVSFYLAITYFASLRLNDLLRTIYDKNIIEKLSFAVGDLSLINWISITLIVFLAFLGYQLLINWTETLRETLHTQRSALFESEERFRQAINNSTDVFIVYDNKLRYKYLNNKGLERYGLTFEDVFGKRDEEILPDAVTGAYLPALRLAVESALPQTKECMIDYFGAKYTFIVSYIPILNNQGKVEEILGVSYDITERKSYEEKLEELQFIVNKSQAIAFLWKAAPGWPVEFVTDNISQFGYSSEELISGKVLFTDIMHKDDIKRVAEEVKHYTISGVNEFSQEYRIITRSGTVRWIDDRTWIRRNKDGKVTHYQGMVIDITQRKAFERKLSFMEERFLLVAKTANDIIWDWNLQTGEVWWGGGLKEIFGYETDHTDPTADEWIRKIHPDESAFVHENITKAINDPERYYWEAEYRFLKIDGNYAFVYDRGYIIRDSQKAIRMIGVMIDITERKKAEELIYKKEEEFRALVENTPDIITRFDKKLRHIYVNPAIERSIGVKPDLFIGKTHRELGMPQHLVNLWENLLLSVFKTGKENHHEFEFETKDGVKYYSSTIVPEFNKDGKIESVISIARDITQAKLAEIALKGSEERYRLLFKKNPMPMWVYSVNTLKFLAVNDAAINSYGYSREDFLSMTIKDIRPPEDIPRLMKVIESRKRGYFNAGVWNHLKKDGTIINVEVISHMIEFDGQPAKFVLSNDITEKKKAEDKLVETNILLLRTLESLTEAVFVVDLPTTEIISCNPSAEILTGLKSAEIVNNTFTRLFDSSENVYRIEQLRNTLKTKGFISGEQRLVKTDGSIVYVEYNAKLLGTSDKDKNKAVFAVRDITERKKHFEELIDYQDRLRALAANLQSVREAERAAIAREIHDEIGQVLTSLKMNLTLIGRKLNKDASPEIIMNVSEEITSLNRTIDSSVQRIRKLITVLRPEMLDSLGLISALEWQAQDFESRFHIKVKFKSMIDEIKFSDETAIGIFRIFQETCTNIARHSGADKVTVEIYMEDSTFNLIISDNGKGISEDNLKHSGTFGLLGMRERALIIGGELVIKGIPGSGTIVKLSVPVSAVAEMN